LGEASFVTRWGRNGERLSWRRAGRRGDVRLKLDDVARRSVADGKPSLTDADIVFVEEIEVESRVGDAFGPEVFDLGIDGVSVLAVDGCEGLSLPKVKRTTGVPDSGQTMTVGAGLSPTRGRRGGGAERKYRREGYVCDRNHDGPVRETV